MLAGLTWASLWLGSAAAADFTLSSPSVVDGKLTVAQVLNGFGCTGGNRSPALAWTDPPAGTKSLALTIYDPDAPTGSGWWHWVVFNLPADLRDLPEGAGDGAAPHLPASAIQSRTDFGAPGYGGACPPEGSAPHRYEIKLWALDVEKLDLAPDASGAMVGFFLNAHKVAVAELIATYGR